MWRELILDFCPEATFSEPASDEAIAGAEAALGVSFPEELAKYGYDVIWSCEKLVRQNNAYRANDDFVDLYMPFDPLLFFGQARNGDLYAYVILRGARRWPTSHHIARPGASGVPPEPPREYSSPGTRTVDLLETAMPANPTT